MDNLLKNEIMIYKAKVHNYNTNNQMIIIFQEEIDALNQALNYCPVEEQKEISFKLNRCYKHLQRHQRSNYGVLDELNEMKVEIKKAKKYYKKRLKYSD